MNTAIDKTDLQHPDMIFELTRTQYDNTEQSSILMINLPELNQILLSKEGRCNDI